MDVWSISARACPEAERTRELCRVEQRWCQPRAIECLVNTRFQPLLAPDSNLPPSPHRFGLRLVFSGTDLTIRNGGISNCVKTDAEMRRGNFLILFTGIVSYQQLISAINLSIVSIHQPKEKLVRPSVALSDRTANTSANTSP